MLVSKLGTSTKMGTSNQNGNKQTKMGTVIQVDQIGNTFLMISNLDNNFRSRFANM